MERTVTTTQCVELVNSTGVSGLRFVKAQTTIRVAQIMQAARIVYDAYEVERRAMLEQYGSADPETGQLVTDTDGKIKFKGPSSRKDFEARHHDLLAAVTTVTVPRVSEEDLEAAEMTPGAIFALMPFVDVKLE